MSRFPQHPTANLCPAVFIHLTDKKAKKQYWWVLSSILRMFLVNNGDTQQSNITTAAPFRPRTQHTGTMQANKRR